MTTELRLCHQLGIFMRADNLKKNVCPFILCHAVHVLPIRAAGIQINKRFFTVFTLQPLHEPTIQF